MVWTHSFLVKKSKYHTFHLLNIFGELQVTFITISGVSVMNHSCARNTFLLVLFCICLFAGSLSAQKVSDFYDIKFQKLSTDNVLPSNIIAGVVQDRNGFIWIGTSNGLARYDGVKVKLFQNLQSDSTSLPNNLIKDIQIDPGGILWLGTANGIVKFDPAREKFTDLHQYANLFKLRGYYARISLDDQARLSCWDMYSKSYIIIDTKTDSLLAVFNEETIGRQYWMKGDKRLFFVDQDDFWMVANSGELIVVHLQNNQISTRRISENISRDLIVVCSLAASYKNSCPSNTELTCSWLNGAEQIQTNAHDPSKHDPLSFQLHTLDKIMRNPS